MNAIVGVSEVHNLKAFVEKVMENAEGLDGRVAFVVGVNAEESARARSGIGRPGARRRG